MFPLPLSREYRKYSISVQVFGIIITEKRPNLQSFLISLNFNPIDLLFCVAPKKMRGNGACKQRDTSKTQQIVSLR